jgi:methionyl-tRNA formyltransferase
VRLVVAGTPEVALPSLEAMARSSHEVVAVVTRPDAPAGRGRKVAPSAVAGWAQEHGVPVLRPERPGDPQFLDELRAIAPDCCPVIAYGALVPRAALDIPKHGWVNLHFSILPAWRGAAPVQRALIAGDELVGASTFALEEGLDTGPVYGVMTETVQPDDTTGDLLDRLARAGAPLLVATLDGIEDGSLVPRAQPADGVSLAPKLSPAEARLDWTQPAPYLHRLARACTPAPGAWTVWRGDRLKLGPLALPVDASAATDPMPIPAGRLVVSRDGVLVGTATAPLRLGEVQPPGRRAMPAIDWARGVRPGTDEGFDT